MMAVLSGWKQRQIKRHIQMGGLLAYPTEGVYGLGCDPANPKAVAHLLDLKQRPAHKGMILIAADVEQLRPYIEFPDASTEAKVISTWPGPVTWVLPVSDHAPVWVTGRHQSIAVRVTDHPLAAAICLAAGSALVSTSANPAGRPPARNAVQARQRVADDGLLIIAGRTGELNQPTPIYDARSGAQLR